MFERLLPAVDTLHLTNKLNFWTFWFIKTYNLVHLSLLGPACLTYLCSEQWQMRGRCRRTREQRQPGSRVNWFRSNVLLLPGLSDLSGLRMHRHISWSLQFKDKCVLYWCFIFLYCVIKSQVWSGKNVRSVLCNLKSCCLRHFIMAVMTLGCICFALLHGCALIRRCCWWSEDISPHLICR